MLTFFSPTVSYTEYFCCLPNQIEEIYQTQCSGSELETRIRIRVYVFTIQEIHNSNL